MLEITCVYIFIQIKSGSRGGETYLASMVMGGESRGLPAVGAFGCGSSAIVVEPVFV